MGKALSSAALHEHLAGEPFFLAALTRAAAEDALAVCPTGAFVLRPSSQASCVALSHKTPAGIGHALIASTEGGFILENTSKALRIHTLALKIIACISIKLSNARSDGVARRRAREIEEGAPSESASGSDEAARLQRRATAAAAAEERFLGRGAARG